MQKISVPTRPERSAQEVMDDVIAACHEICRMCGVSLHKVSSVGVGVPGAAYPSGVDCVNLSWKDVPFRQYLSQRLKKLVYVANDADCAALAEYHCGAGRGFDNVVVITLGTGVGAGVIVNGQLIRGAGEIGHMVIQADGRLCSCTRKGCLEAYCGTNGLLLTAREKGMQGELSPKLIFDLAKEGDRAAKQTVDAYIFYLGQGIVNAINLLAPQAVILGGGIAQAGSILFDAIIKVLDKEVLHGRVKIKLLPASMGNDAGIIGAAMLR